MRRLYGQKIARLVYYLFL